MPVPEDIPLDILYEDEFLAVINKPADMVVHPAKGHWSGTLVNALRFHFGQLSDAQRRLPARHRPSPRPRHQRRHPHRQGGADPPRPERCNSSTRKIFKEYIAITAGVLDRDSDYIEGRIGHHPHDRVKMAVADDDDEDGKEACSYYEVIERFRGFTFCPHPAAHRADAPDPRPPGQRRLSGAGRQDLQRPRLLAAVGPGAAAWSRTEDEVLLPRQALHAHRLRFRHPVHNNLLEITAPLPEEIRRTLEALRNLRPAK